MKKSALFFLWFALSSFEFSQARPVRQPFTIVIQPQNGQPKSGSEVWINVRLTNSSNSDLDMSGGFSDTTRLDPNYHFDVRDEHGRPVPKRVYPHPELDTGSPVNRIVKPQETFTEEQRVSALYDMKRPGQYVIQVWRRASENPKDGVVKSNVITITVVN
jgi:hypothetical protein